MGCIDDSFRVTFSKIPPIPGKSSRSKMSKARGLLPGAIAAVIGISTGIAIFDPAFKEEKEQKEQEGQVSICVQRHSSETDVLTAG